MATIYFSETFAKRRAIFLSVRKTVNIQGYSKLGDIPSCLEPFALLNLYK